MAQFMGKRQEEMRKMTYRTYSLLVVDSDFSRWIEVAAISIEAAKADCVAAYGEIQILQGSAR